MLWVGEFLCVIYVKKCCPSHAPRNKTPYEIWYGHIPLVRHVKVSGSALYVLFPRKKEEILSRGV